MLDKVSQISNISYVPRISAGKALNPQPKTALTQNPGVSMNGNEALAAYNSVLISKSPNLFNIPQVEPINIPRDINQIKGERVYTSDGDLYKIVDEDRRYKRVYLPSENADYQYIIYDKMTSKAILEQHTSEDTLCVSIYKNNKNGAEEYYTRYKNGHPSYKAYTKDYNDGSRRVLDQDIDQNGEYSSLFFDKNSQKETEKYYNCNRELTREKTILRNNDSNIIKEYGYDNGVLCSKREEKIESCSNEAYQSPLSDPDLTVVKPGKYELNLDKLKGEKTYYSNGEVESIRTPDGLEYLVKDIEDALIIKDKDKTTELIKEPDGTKSCTCVETDPEKGTEKTTHYMTYRTGKTAIITKFKNGEFEKCLRIENGKPSSYSEYNNGKETLWIEYDNNGNAIKQMSN